MRCDRCGKDAILFQEYSGLRLCGDHALISLESRAKRTIRARGWVRPGDRIAIGLSGGPCSSSLLHFLSAHFGTRRDLFLVALTAGGDPASGGCPDLAGARRMADGLGVEWEGIPDPGRAGDPRRETGAPGPGGTLPGPLYRALVSLATGLGATKLALGTSLDARAGAVFLDVIRGDGPRLRRRPDRDGVTIPLVLPFSRVPEEELLLYARLKGIDPLTGKRPEAPGSFEEEAGRLLHGYTRRHPSTPFSVVNLAGSLAGEGGGRQRGGASRSRSAGQAGSSRWPGGCPE
jgi:tRNA(Ile)-lysidine synthase TilS/MesJ